MAIGFAHRGARAHAPENTLEAFSLALEMGARGLESDAWLTGDGVVVLDHDGVAPGGVPIRDVLHAALPPHIPTLDALYGECGSAYELSLDVKDESAAPGILAAAQRADAAARLWLCHWNWKTVASWRPHSGQVRLVDSTRLQHMRTAPDARAARMRDRGIDALNLHHSDWDAPLVDAMHAQGRLALAWDAQDDATLGRCLALGIDGVYSDHVDRLTSALRSVDPQGSAPVYDGG